MASSPADNTANVADTQYDLRRDIFPFFSLPRELRDIIYTEPALIDECSTALADQDFVPVVVDRARNPLPLHDSLHLPDRDGLRISASIRKTNLLTVSKQFLAEYIDATKSTCNKVVVTDINYGDNGITLPNWTKPCSSIQFNLAAWCIHDEYPEDDFDGLWGLIHSTYYPQELPNVTEVEIRINTQTSFPEKSIRDILNRDWIQFPHLKSLDVYRIAEPVAWKPHNMSPVFTYEEPETLLLRFSPEKARVELVEG
ncbi:hypothetical protein HII31_05235 [Pseudocercospora fuligena]|uniref:Uncharacterized protein n=1 Tax=Pseudocercospora fuligena TaxID=685502 RepID=A0A8H6RKF3_9PEZI|nr:hypothetical protein HII31_05235 [Pseudocercospora fuligena]